MDESIPEINWFKILEYYYFFEQYIFRAAFESDNLGKKGRWKKSMLKLNLGTTSLSVSDFKVKNYQQINKTVVYNLRNISNIYEH